MIAMVSCGAWRISMMGTETDGGGIERTVGTRKYVGLETAAPIENVLHGN